MSKNARCLKEEWVEKLSSTIVWWNKKKEKHFIHSFSRAIQMSRHYGRTKRNVFKLFHLLNLPWLLLSKVKMKLLLETFLLANLELITTILIKVKRVDTFIPNIIHTSRETIGSLSLQMKHSQVWLLLKSLQLLITSMKKSSKKGFRDQEKFHSHQSWLMIHIKVSINFLKLK